MFRKWAALAGALTALVAPGAAQAKWYRAETDRFVVYGEGREAKVREMAARLTAFDAVLRLHNPPPDGRSPRKLDVYMVGGPAPGVAFASYIAGAVLIGKGRKAEADRILAVVANAPHGGRMAAQARALMAGRTTAEAEAAGAKEGEEEAEPPPPAPSEDRKTPAV